MKRKYYMRGLGVGVLVTALLCAVAFPKQKKSMTDEQVIARAKELGYEKKDGGVTPEDIDKLKENEKSTGTPGPTDTPTTIPEGPTPFPEPTPEAPQPPEQPEKPTSPTPGAEKLTGTPKPTPTNTPKPTSAKTPTPKPKATSTPKPTAGADGKISVKVEKGMTARKVAERLESVGIIADAEDFIKYLVKEKLADSINVGTFSIPKGAGYSEIGKILTK